MARGFLSGVIWGVVLSAMVLWVASQLGGMISLLLAPPGQVSDQAPPPPQTAAAPEPAPAAPEPGALPATEPSRLGLELPAGTAETPPRADTAPARAPGAEAEAAPPAEPAQAAEPAVPGRIGEEPARPDTALAGLPAPGADAAPREIEDAPAPRAAPAGVAAPDAPPPPGQPAPTTPAAPEADSAPAAVSEPQIVDLPAPREDEPPMPGGATQPPGQAEVTALPPQEQEQPPATDSAPASGPRVLRPGEGGLRSNRLPTIGGESATMAEEPAEDQAVDEVDENAPAIERFAVPFENPEGRPLMAVILLPDPAADATQIATLPFPVSYAVDASRADATERMRAIRAAGYEVVLLAPLPEDASPRDAEVAFESYLAAVPEAVAVLDSRAAVFQSGRLLASQVADILADTGHGMITYARGLNSAIQVAEREGIPAALVFRDIDGSGQDAAAVKRFLDQAAFRAGQLKRVVLVARNRPETIRALVEWSLGNRARTVTLAPISAVLLGR